MSLKPWREVAVPHRDVLEGTFLQSEFAADLSAVQAGGAPPEYQDAVAFFERTFITEGMSILLTQVAERLSGRGGEPVIQLQTAFGGGKTHTLIAVYHLATRTVALSELAGMASLLDRAGLIDVPQARVAVIDGTKHGAGQPWAHGKTTVRTLWGELAWQLGGADGYAKVQASDENGTSPGKEVLSDLLRTYSPCVVLVDELVAFVRQLEDGKSYSAGTYDSNLSFVQALTEAAKLSPRAIVLGSLPESEIEAGSSNGVRALAALEKTFGRVQALWKPVATEEAFEIVRRRLFEPVRDAKVRDTVCRAFADAYVQEGTKVPAETQESRYFDRLVQAYPIHPEVFDRLYEDWTTIEGFQRTRGVLKLMAKVIHKLWKDDNKDLVILPGSMPLYDPNTRSELLLHLRPGWDPIVDKDIDGNKAATTDLETKEPRFGAVQAARRVARAVFFGSAPSSVAAKQSATGIRGLDRGRVLLGCLQPGQASSLYSDALNRLVDRLHYLNSSGDKAVDSTRYWFDLRANLRREMEERKKRFDDKTDVRAKLAEVAKKLVSAGNLFDGVHVFTGHGDVPDDSALRLVVMPPESWYSKAEPKVATEAVLEAVKYNGSKPRYRGNRLLFIMADQTVLGRLRDAAKVCLAWGSIVEDVKDGKLNIDQLQKKQAETELKTADEVLPRVLRETYKWLLCPAQASPGAPTEVEAYPLNTGGAASTTSEVERICRENELVIKEWSPFHLHSKLAEVYWKGGKVTAGALAFWEDSQKYLYLPRLKNRDVLAEVVKSGAAKSDFFGTADGESDGRYLGFALAGGHPQLTDTLLLIEPEAAAAYAKRLEDERIETEARARQEREAREKGTQPNLPIAPPDASQTTNPSNGKPGPGPGPGPDATTKVAPKAKSYHASADINASMAKKRLSELADEIISVLANDPTASVRLTLEISADFPNGVSDQIKRAVSENAKSLGVKVSEWE